MELKFQPIWECVVLALKCPQCSIKTIFSNQGLQWKHFQNLLYDVFALGGVFYITEQGKCVQMFNADSPVHKLLFYEEKNILVTVTSSLMLCQHTVSSEGECREILKVLYIYYYCNVAAMS